MLTNQHKVLLGKAIGDKVWKEAAKAIGQGTAFQSSLIARISGSMKIGAPYPQAIMQTFPWQRLALMLATRVPRHVLDKVLRDLHGAEAPGELKEHVGAMWGEINAKARQMCNGKVTGRPVIEVLQRIGE